MAEKSGKALFPTELDPPSPNLKSVFRFFEKHARASASKFFLRSLSLLNRHFLCSKKTTAPIQLPLGRLKEDLDGEVRADFGQIPRKNG